VIVVVNSIPTLPTAHFWLNFRLNHQSGWAACFHSAHMCSPFSSLVPRFALVAVGGSLSLFCWCAGLVYCGAGTVTPICA
jgi:hypothetical protein